jgi:hypothetical protein
MIETATSVIAVTSNSPHTIWMMAISLGFNDAPFRSSAAKDTESAP